MNNLIKGACLYCNQPLSIRRNSAGEKRERWRDMGGGEPTLR
jgi:hypothetical protein